MEKQADYFLGEDHKGREFFRGYDLVVSNEDEAYLRALGKGENPQLKGYVDAERVCRFGTISLNGRLNGPKALTHQIVGTRGRVDHLVGDQKGWVLGKKGRKVPDFSGYESRLTTESDRLTQIVRRRIDEQVRDLTFDSNDLKGIGLEVWGLSSLSLTDSAKIQAPFAIDRDAWVNGLFKKIIGNVIDSHQIQLAFARTDSKEEPVSISTRSAVAAK